MTLSRSTSGVWLSAMAADCAVEQVDSACGERSSRSKASASTAHARRGRVADARMQSVSSAARGPRSRRPCLHVQRAALPSQGAVTHRCAVDGAQRLDATESECEQAGETAADGCAGLLRGLAEQGRERQLGGGPRDRCQGQSEVAQTRPEVRARDGTEQRQAHAEAGRGWAALHGQRRASRRGGRAVDGCACAGGRMDSDAGRGRRVRTSMARSQDRSAG